ncbi:MAPEG family protein [Noviherbaspirillum sp. L7-7A]|nr:MAPEG family protein [Noviherbaspirillum sp. L7-7A]MBV0881702.1 MAPEG family protein [Noviherbaspirillum sp. L7-7A]
MRAHANSAKYVPLTLLLIYLIEIAPAHVMLVHALSLALLLGRALHAGGVSRSPEDFRFRVASMSLTLASLLSASLYLLLAHVSAALAPLAGRD